MSAHNLALVFSSCLFQTKGQTSEEVNVIEDLINNYVEIFEVNILCFIFFLIMKVMHAYYVYRKRVNKENIKNLYAFHSEILLTSISNFINMGICKSYLSIHIFLKNQSLYRLYSFELYFLKQMS